MAGRRSRCERGEYSRKLGGGGGQLVTGGRGDREAKTLAQEERRHTQSENNTISGETNL